MVYRFVPGSSCMPETRAILITMHKKYSGLTTVRLVVEHEPFLVGSVTKEQIKATGEKPVVVDEMVESTDSFLDLTFEI